MRLGKQCDKERVRKLRQVIDKQKKLKREFGLNIHLSFNLVVRITPVRPALSTFTTGSSFIAMTFQGAEYVLLNERLIYLFGATIIT